MAGIRAPLAIGLTVGLLAAAAVIAAAAGQPEAAALSADEIARLTSADRATALTAYQDLVNAAGADVASLRLARAIDDSRDPQRRRALIECLHSMGMQGGPAAPALVRALRAPEKPVRLAALATLYNMGVGAGVASVGPLVAALGDPDAEIRAAAARSFYSLGSAIWQDDPEYGDVCRAAQAGQQPLAALAADPKQPHEVRLEAASALAEMPVDARVVPALVVALAAPDADVREKTCRALARTKSRDAVPALEARLRDPSAKVQVAAAEALLAAGAGKSAVERLAQILVEPGVEMRDRAGAAWALQQQPADAQPALRQLVEVALMPHQHLIESMPSDGREDVRRWAERAIKRIGAPAVPFLLPYVDAQSRSGDGAAIRVVCWLGPAAKSAVPALMPLLKSRYGGTRGQVASCLVADIRVDPKVIAPRVLPMLSDRDPEVRRDVVRVTKFLGPAAAPALPRLRQLARDKDGDVRVDALDTLAVIGAAARPARRDIEDGLTDGEERVQVAAALALVKTRIAPDAGVKRLIELLTDKKPRPGPGTRSRSAPWRLGELASLPEGKQVLAALVAALESPDAGIHDGVAHSLVSFGDEAAATALVPLTKTLDRDQYGISKEACAALASFGPKILPAVPALVKRLAGGNAETSAAEALFVTARRSPEVDAAVRAECAKTQGWHLRRCSWLIRRIDEPATAVPAP